MRFEPWAQYCKCLAVIIVFIILYIITAASLFPVHFWPRYSVLCWTLILFSCNSTMFETRQENHRFLHDTTVFICPTLTEFNKKWAVNEKGLQLYTIIKRTVEYAFFFVGMGGGVMQLTAYYVDLYVKRGYNVINHNNLLCVHLLFWFSTILPGSDNCCRVLISV